jgi:phage I-like protein
MDTQTPFSAEICIAAHLAEMPSDAANVAPTEIHLIPAGQFTGRDGRGPYLLDTNAVVADFASLGMPLAIDYEHQSVHAADNGQPAPAAGWIKAIDARADGLWGSVEWTDKASAMIAAREYRYLSPVFEHDAEGKVLALVGAGLTNHPNLHLTAINKMAAQQTHSTKGTMMEDILERLRYLFNLPTLATEADIAAELVKVSALLAAPESAAMRQGLALPEDARLPQILTAVCAYQFADADKMVAEQAQSRFDPAQFVPRAEYDRVVAEHKAREEAQIGEAVELAIHAEKITPAEKAWALEYCRKDPAGFAAHVASRPTVGLGAHKSAATPAVKPADNPLIADANRRLQDRRAGF